MCAYDAYCGLGCLNVCGFWWVSRNFGFGARGFVGALTCFVICLVQGCAVSVFGVLLLFLGVCYRFPFELLVALVSEVDLFCGFLWICYRCTLM